MYICSAERKDTVMTFYFEQKEYPLTPSGKLVVYRYAEKFGHTFWGAHYTLNDSGFAYPYKELLTRKPCKRQIQNWIDQLSH